MASARDEGEGDRRPAGTDAVEGDDGVDVSLVRWLLSLSVRERLTVLQTSASSLARLRDAAAER